VLISGATGTVGRALVRQLLSSASPAHTLTVWSRDAAAARELFTRDLGAATAQGLTFVQPSSGSTDADAVVHLAGQKLNFSRTWNGESERVIRDSRVLSARQILQSLSAPPKVWISASAVGWYGLKSDASALHVESEAPASDFTGRICQAVEAEAGEAAKRGARTVCLRLGVVLANDAGGALEQMATPVSMFVGAPIGSGKQHVPWVHVEDAAAAFRFALDNNALDGAFNLVAPEHVNNEQMTQAIARVLGRPLLVPFNVPGFVLTTALGDFAQLALEGSRVSSQKLRDAGFTFQFAGVDGALRDLLARK
jgi:uncharacterized protein (TIGR01777 family)